MVLDRSGYTVTHSSRETQVRERRYRLLGGQREEIEDCYGIYLSMSLELRDTAAKEPALEGLG